MAGEAAQNRRVRREGAILHAALVFVTWGERKLVGPAVKRKAVFEVVILVELADVGDCLLPRPECPARAVELERTRVRRARLGFDNRRMARRALLRTGEGRGDEQSYQRSRPLYWNWRPK